MVWFFSAEARNKFEIHLISKSKLKNMSRMGSLKTDAPRISSSMRKTSTLESQSTLEACNHSHLTKEMTRFSQLPACLYHSTGRRISQKFQLVSSSCPNLQRIRALAHISHHRAGFLSVLIGSQPRRHCFHISRQTQSRLRVEISPN